MVDGGVQMIDRLEQCAFLANLVTRQTVLTRRSNAAIKRAR